MHDSPATKPKVETDQYDSPCSLPKPNQNVFHSVGKLTKKHDSLHERLSLPLHLTTPNTPKSNRSRFVLPSSLSPFPLSPKNITSPTLNNAKPLSASYHAVSTPLKIGFSSEHLNNFEPETLSKSSRSPSRSQWERPGSPNVVSSSLVRESDILELSSSFGYEDDSSDDGMEIEDDTDIGAYDISPEMLRPVLWRNPVVNFLTREYFEGIETGPTLNRPCFDPEGLVDYFSCRFEIIESFGDGSFSNVFKVFDRIDGKIYAVKRSKKPFSGTIDRYVFISFMANYK